MANPVHGPVGHAAGLYCVLSDADDDDGPSIKCINPRFSHSAQSMIEWFEWGGVFDGMVDPSK